MTDGLPPPPPPPLPPQVQRRVDAAREHRDQLLGLTAGQAVQLAAERDLDLQLVRPGQLVTLDWRPTRLRAYLDDRDVVVRAAVG